MFGRTLRSAVVSTTVLAAVLAAAHRFDPVGEGLTATHYFTRDGSGSPAGSALDPAPSTKRLNDAWQGRPPQVFSTTWAGSVLIPRAGAYTLATVSDDGSRVYVDGRLVVDNGGRHGPVEARGTVTLTRGVHGLFIQYAQEGGGVHFELRWAREGGPLETVPAWALSPRRASVWAFELSAGLRRALAAAQWLWVGTLLIAVAALAWRVLQTLRAWLVREQVWPQLGWILAGSLLLNATGLWWGLPGASWAPDELTPFTVIFAASRHFSHGWFDRYPPFHFYLLTAAYSPLLLLEWWGRIDLDGERAATVLAVIGRAVSVAAGSGVVVSIYACGARLFGRRAGLFASAMAALVTPFVYYAKTANLDVPYLFWFSVSLWFYLRLLDTLRPVDFAGFAASATLAVLTKDQAYGLYVLPPFLLVYRIWQVNRAGGVPNPLARAVFDRRLLSAGLLAALLFACGHNLLFNWNGFVDHVRYITGGGSESYREFEPTIGGRLALAGVTADLIRVGWGWPLFLVSLAGVAAALFTRRTRQGAIWALTPAVSYYLFFTNVVLYNYDRFVLPIAVVFALFGGLAIDRWLEANGHARPWRGALVGAVFAYSLIYAATVDVMMLSDSRYAVERWMGEHVGANDLVGYVFPMQYYPRLERFNNAEIASVDELAQAQPAYYVLNAEYARAEPVDSPIGRLITGLQTGALGYQLVFRYRQPPPWPWVPGAPRDLVGPRTEVLITSALRHINPTFEVFKQRP